MFDPNRYGRDVAEILALDGGGNRLMPLAHGTCSVREAYQLLMGVNASTLFPGARSPEAALSGLYLYFSCLDESHEISQGIHTAEGSFLHGIMHRQEPDASNAGYWFHRVGDHPVFPILQREATEIAARHGDAGFDPGKSWDPFRFIDFCEKARRRLRSPEERLALEIQRAEWQLLFDYCASPVGSSQVEERNGQ